MADPRLAHAPGDTSLATPAVSGPDVAQWHALGPEEAIRELRTSPTGLTDEEARSRLEVVGPNLIQQVRGASALEILWRQVSEPMIYVLLGSGLLALAMGKTVDGLVVLGVVAVNSLIGFVQEFRAGRAIRALMDIVPDTATVLRSGERRTLPAAELVPGDIVFLDSGDKVPADLRLISMRSLRMDEAMLTGESVPVSKAVDLLPAGTGLADRRNLAFGGTLVVSGSVTGVVCATGAGTELGRISSLLQEADPLVTPLVRQLGRVGKWLAVGIVAVALVLLTVGLARGYPLVDALLVAVTLAVAAIPEGLPAIVTIALAIGVQRMARRRALIRSLPAAETLGGTTVICSDKTGTLTRNEMTVQVVHTPTAAYTFEGVGYAPEGEVLPLGGPGASGELEELLAAGVLASDAELHRAAAAWQITGDPTEGALLVAAAKAGVQPGTVRSAWRRLDVIPFESERRFMAALVREGAHGSPRLLAKGAPEAILGRCAPGVDRTRILDQVEELAARGMRVLAVAARDWEPGGRQLEDEDVAELRFLGLFGMIDPPRPEAIAAIERCHKAGVAVKMITGDHRATAVAIGRQLGLATGEDQGVTGADLDRLGPEALGEVAARESVFARVAPEHKLALVRALQAQGHVVAMTGDGVNDSPALKQADIGVAMGITGTAASKEAADIVLADDNFATIAAAVEEGRRVYDNLLKSFAFVLPTNLGLALILLAAVTAFPMVAGEPLLPMTPTQTLWINLVAAVALALPLAFEAMEPNVMRRPPRPRDEPLLGGFVLFRSVVVAVLMAAGAIGLFLFEYHGEVARGVSSALALREAQTMAVTTVVLFQVFYLLNCRSLRDSILRIGVFTNPYVYLGIATVLLLQLGFVYLPLMNGVFGTAPLNGDALLKSVLVAAVVLPAITVEKWWRRYRREAVAAPRR